MTHQFVVPAWARLGTAAVMAAAVLSGCTGSQPDPGPTGATATSPTESATESPTPTEEPTETSALPPLPEEATENTPEGAEAFIRYYVDVANLAHQTPQLGLVPQLASDVCESCVTMEQQVSDLVAKGERVEEPVYQIDKIEPIGGSTGGVQLFNMNVTLPANRILTAEGAEASSYEATEISGRGGAIWEGDRWWVYELTLTP